MEFEESYNMHQYRERIKEITVRNVKKWQSLCSASALEGWIDFVDQRKIKREKMKIAVGSVSCSYHTVRC